MLLGMALGSQLQVAQDLYLNQLNMSFGINFKYNGLLHHNIDRVWVVTKVVIPRLEDVFFPDIKFDPDCSFVRKLQNSRQAAKIEIESICKSMKPLISFMKQKEKYYEKAIAQLLKEEIPWSLLGSGYSHSGSNFQDPVSDNQRFSCDTSGNRALYARRRQSRPWFLL